MTRGPVLIDRSEPAPGAPPRAADPASAPPVPDPLSPAADDGAAMRGAIALGARPSGTGLGGLLLGALTALAGFLLSLAAWSFVTRLLAERPVLGWIAAALIGAVLLLLLLVVLRELIALSRLARIGDIRGQAEAAASAGDLTAARAAAARLTALYADRPELGPARDRIRARAAEAFDADAVLALAETELLAGLDQAARREVEAAARTVATVTALVPLALADVVAALAANVRMIRRLAEIYGGRAGTLGSWRLARTVMTHLVATGAVAAGDDLIGSVAGGGLLAKVSRRFGEGVVNGALTARVGLAAIEVCRPLPFAALPAPRVSALVGRALAGLFGRDGDPPPEP